MTNKREPIKHEWVDGSYPGWYRCTGCGISRQSKLDSVCILANANLCSICFQVISRSTYDSETGNVDYKYYNCDCDLGE